MDNKKSCKTFLPKEREKRKKTKKCTRIRIIWSSHSHASSFSIVSPAAIVLAAFRSIARALLLPKTLIGIPNYRRLKRGGSNEKK